jgi:hypothetical protein
MSTFAPTKTETMPKKKRATHVKFRREDILDCYDFMRGVVRVIQQSEGGGPLVEYTEDWSDAKLAAKYSLPAHTVIALRKMRFGPLINQYVFNRHDRKKRSVESAIRLIEELEARVSYLESQLGVTGSGTVRPAASNANGIVRTA